MSGFLGELMGLLQSAPKFVKYIIAIVLLLPILLILASFIGLPYWIVIVGLLVIAGLLFLVNILFEKRDKKKGDAFEGELAKESAGASRDEVRVALRDLTEKWKQAMTELKAARIDIYQLPWYMLIGEPQSGKSTTLANSGLEFPIGKEALSGAGGTRNCDWWFSNEAVILDTAGRFTFQEDAAPDREEWSSFLKLLKKYRPYCPINGVLVVIPSTTLLEDTAEERERKAQNIRGKLLNIQKVLQIRFPVFLMITKSDRVLGFSEFFSRLDPEHQRQLVGWSNPEETTVAFDPAKFEGVWESIVERIHKLRLKFLSTEESVSQVDRLFPFPEELRALGNPLGGYIKTIFSTTRYEEPLLFRGLYLSSGVQQGKPIAQATRDLLSVAGASANEVVESLESIFKKSRAFFIKDFYEKKVFPEQGLIARTKVAEMQDRKLRTALAVIGIFVVVLVLCGMVLPFLSLRQTLNPIREAVDEAAACDQGAAEEPCTPQRAYLLAQKIQVSRDSLAERRLTLLLFLRGRENELADSLLAIQRKLLMKHVAAPLLVDAEARMGNLDWKKQQDLEKSYKPFFEALQSLLQWHAAQTAPTVTIKKDAVGKAKEERDTKKEALFRQMRLAPLFDLVRATKGTGTREHGAEIEKLVASIKPQDAIKADKLLEGMAPPKPEEEATVPDPARAVAKFEEFWSIQNLARWDYELQLALGELVASHGALTTLSESGEARLQKTTEAARRFAKAWRDVEVRLGTPRPSEKSFPGPSIVQWSDFLSQSYRKVILWTLSLPTSIAQERYDALAAALQQGVEALNARQDEGSHFVARDPTGKLAPTKPATVLGPLIADLGAYTDLPTFRAGEDGRILTLLASVPNWEEKRAKLDGWWKRQEDVKKGVFLKLADLGATPLDPRFRFAELRPSLERSAEIALAARALPVAQDFFAQSLGSACPGDLCCNPAFARPQVALANSIVSAASQWSLYATDPEVKASVGRIVQTELDYLRRCMGQAMDARSLSAGGEAFVFPSGWRAGSWAGFRTAIATWQPVRAGGPPPPGAEPGASLTAQDIATFAQGNNFLNPLLTEFNKKATAQSQQKEAGKVSPDLIASVEKFKQIVTSLPDQPKVALSQLTKEPDWQRKFRSFSENAALRRGNRFANDLKGIEDHGLKLLQSETGSEVAGKLTPQIKQLQSFYARGMFPFVTSAQLRDKRMKYDAGTLALRTGNTATLRLDTMRPQEITEILGALASEDLNEATLATLGNDGKLARTALEWARFLYGAPAPGAKSPTGGALRDRGIEVRFLPDAAPSATSLQAKASVIAFFDDKTLIRPATSQRLGTKTMFTYSVGASEAPLTIKARNEGARTEGVLLIEGGALRLFAFLLLASDGAQEDGRVHVVRLRVPDPGSSQMIEGRFELRFDDPLPGVLPD
ncbi:MAG: hypothetical protein JNK60_04495 [Acidobacteria bacterium]|nr:hypothetical protein [Acidobacteriota bacterium]